MSLKTQDEKKNGAPAPPICGGMFSRARGGTVTRLLNMLLWKVV